MGYEIAAKGYTDLLSNIQKLDEKVDNLKAALYGDGPDRIGIFERIRSLAVRIGFILFILTAVGGFIGRWVEKAVFK